MAIFKAYHFSLTLIKLNCGIYIEKIRESVVEVDKLRDIDTITKHFENSEHISKAYISDVDNEMPLIKITFIKKGKVLVIIKCKCGRKFHDLSTFISEYIIDQNNDKNNIIKETIFSFSSLQLSNNISRILGK